MKKLCSSLSDPVNKLGEMLMTSGAKLYKFVISSVLWSKRCLNHRIYPVVINLRQTIYKWSDCRTNMRDCFLTKSVTETQSEPQRVVDACPCFSFSSCCDSLSGMVLCCSYKHAATAVIALLLISEQNLVICAFIHGWKVTLISTGICVFFQPSPQASFLWCISNRARFCNFFILKW